MNTAIVKKIAIISSILIAIILISIGCNFITRDHPDPTISNPDGTFLSYGSVTVTRGELYERVKVLEGVNHLMNYIDERLLQPYIDNVTETEVEEELEKLKFGNRTEEEIEALTEDELEDIENNYRLTLTMAGFNYQDEEEVNRFLRLAIAKRAVTIEQLIADIDANESSDFEAELLNYYEENYRGDAKAIELIFNSSTEYERVLRHFNLVPSYEGGIGLYFGEDPLSSVAREDLDETNTELLDRDDVFSYYIKIYNYIYPYRDALDENLTVNDVDSFTADYFNFNYNDLLNSSYGASQAAYLFDSLKLDDEDTLSYAVRDRQYTQMQGNTSLRSMVFKIAQEDLEAFDTLDQTTQDEIEEEFIDSLISDERINAKMVSLREENGLKIHDNLLALNYDNNFDQDTYEESESATIIATLDDFTVTADELFTYMTRRVGAMHTVELYKENDLIDSQYFEDLYGSNRNFDQNNSQLMKDHREIILSERQNFANGAYTYYGFSPENYEWREFLYLYYGFASDNDLVRWLVMQNLLKYIAYPNIDYGQAIPYVEEQYDNYFSLRAEHILIYIDQDRDLVPDDFEEFIDGLDEDGLDTYNFLKAQLENELINAVEGGLSLTQVVNEYNNALRSSNASDDDFSVWAQFKNYGFMIKTENLSADDNDLTYRTTGDYVDSFVENLQRIYNDYSLEENSDASTYLDDRVFTTEFGLHLVNARKGTNFEKPSALFENTDGEYDSVWENDSDMPSIEQMEAWAAREFDKLENNGETNIEIPESVDTALRLYFGPHHNRMYNNPNQNTDFFGSLVTITELQDNNVTFTAEDDHLQQRLEALRELYESLVYPEIKNND
ncbi:MAG: hypothetical protein ACLFRI_01365 [Candidatus Izemoplasmataceae bacterium]